MVFNLSLRQLEKEVIESLYSKQIDLHPELYKAYSNNLRKGVSGVFGSLDIDSEYFDIAQRMQANVSRFAAHKAYYATQEIRRQISDKNGNVRSFEDYKKASKSVFNKYNRWQVAEYNTAVARSRTAKQWIDFNADEIQNQLYPNLKWLPSRSADPREEHVKFYGLVLPKNHPFWQENQPGNLWNCKCDWEESDEQTFKGNVPKVNAAKGLENNPGETGEIFTENVSYLKVSSKGNYDIQQFFEPINNNHEKFINYAQSTNYKNVSFSWDNGGLMATHKNHLFDRKKGHYEKNMQKIVYKNGNAVIFESEIGKGIGGRYTDGTWNGKLFEMASAETGTDSNILKGLKHCASKRNTCN